MWLCAIIVRHQFKFTVNYRCYLKARVCQPFLLCFLTELNKLPHRWNVHLAAGKCWKAFTQSQLQNGERCWLHDCTSQLLQHRLVLSKEQNLQKIIKSTAKCYSQVIIAHFDSVKKHCARFQSSTFNLLSCYYVFIWRALVRHRTAQPLISSVLQPTPTPTPQPEVIRRSQSAKSNVKL